MVVGLMLVSLMLVDLGVWSMAEEITPAAGAEVLANGVRVRVFFPFEAWTRFQKMSKRLALEEKTLVRVLASLQLAQLETVYGATTEGMHQAVQAAMDEQATVLLGDLMEAKG
jgi:peroxiredoxin family protein